MLALGGALRLVAETVFPARCIGCGWRGVALCQSCRVELPYLPTSVCRRCASVRGPRGVCRGCRRLSPALTSVRRHTTSTAAACWWSTTWSPPGQPSPRAPIHWRKPALAVSARSRSRAICKPAMLFASEHPLVRHKVALLRHVDTEPKKFRELVRELSMLLCYEATRDLELVTEQIPTPMGTATGQRLRTKIGLIPILRAGLGMVEGFLEMIPTAEVWHIGLYRDERTLHPVEYYNRLPTPNRVQLSIVLDPMLATGGTAVASVDILKRWGCERIKYLGLIAAPEGIERLSQAHPDVPIHVAAVDERLNDIGYIVPGLGDAGDRQFGTS